MPGGAIKTIRGALMVRPRVYHRRRGAVCYTASVTLLIALLAAWVGLLLLMLYASLAATLAHFGRRPGVPAELLPMTLLRPVKGLDDAIERNFDSLVESDPEGRLQILIAMESAEDPAYGPACAFAARHPGRDIEVVLTGPPGDRMGKAHNMIEAAPRAKHDLLIFSDADTRATGRLLQETSDAFRRGCDAVYGLPYHAPAGGVGGLWFMLAFNHFFCVSAALAYLFGQYRFCAGAWMGYTRSALQRAGGLERFSHEIADDYALGRAAAKSGARVGLLREPVLVSETGTGLGETYRHLRKWCVMGRWIMPAAYAAMPFLGLGTAAFLLWAMSASWRIHQEAYRDLARLALVSRVVAGLIQDLAIARRLMPLPAYLALFAADVGSLFVWASGFRRRIEWRGTTYRIHPGGRAEVLSRTI